MKVKYKFFIIIIIMIFLLSVTFVGAAQNDTVISEDAGDSLTVTDDDIQTESSNDEKLSDGNDQPLRYDSFIGVVSQNDKINLSQDIIYENDDNNKVIKVSKNLEIDGNGHYINGQTKAGIFEITGNAKVTLKNLILKNGKYDGGGAIKATGNSHVTVINCTFIDNKVDEASGGAVKTEKGSTISIDGCVFKNNYANGYGGALYINGECSGIANTEFTSNWAIGRGGAVYVYEDNTNGVEFKNCNFKSNQANYNKNSETRCGGAIYSESSGRIRAINTTFSGNYVENTDPGESMSNHKGGAIYCKNDLEIDECLFEMNHAPNHGGAIYADSGIYWYENPSIFIGNSVDNRNTHTVNEGWVIYASKFLSNPKGLVFIKNTGYDGGAIYINNKNVVTFESCYFDGNIAKDTSHGSGATIYLDSTSSKLSLINNIFVNNSISNTYVVYNCGYYDTVKNNWYGTDDPDFNEPYLIEWHMFGKNEKIADSDSLRVEIERDESQREFTIKFVTNSGQPFNGKLTIYNAGMYSDKQAKFTGKTNTDGSMKIVFIPLEDGEHTITFKISSYSKYAGLIFVTIPGDFDILQNLVNEANGILELTRNYTYTVGKDTKIRGIEINKPLIINGNGHTINALGHSKLFEITADNVKLDNLTLINGFSEDDRGAIYWSGNNGSVSNSVFLKNKGRTFNPKDKISNNEIILTFKSSENYINAIRSEHDLTFSNVTYWNGTHITNDPPVNSRYISGIKIKLKIRNGTQIFKEITLTTDENGQVKYSYSELPDGHYEYDGIRDEDDYYLKTTYYSTFELSRPDTSDSIQINMENEKEFNFTNCTIPFTVTGSDKVRVLVTDQNGTIIYIDEESENLNNYTVYLPANDEYYNITIFTEGNETHSPVSDSKLFKILKIKSTTHINPIEDIEYGENVTVTFDTITESANVTVYDYNNNIVFTTVTSENSVTLSDLAVGIYNLTVTTLADNNYLESNASTTFKVGSDNNVEVFAEDSDYGREVFIGIIADVDGTYTVNLNGTEVTIEVVDGEGAYYDLLDLNAGNYTTKVIFENPGHNTIVNNADFTIYTAESNLKIYEIGNVTYGGCVYINFYDDYPTIFYIEVIDENNTEVFNTTFEYSDKRSDMSVIVEDLEVGEYVVNIENYGDDNVIGSSSSMFFNVTELPGSIIASNLTRGYNSGIDFSVKLVNKNGTGIANTIVRFAIDGKEYNAITDANGVAVINDKLAVGTYTVDVINPYNDALTTHTLKIVNRITGNKNVNTYYGKNYQYKLRIIGDDGKAVGAGVSVKVTINGKAKTLKTDKNGYITVKFTKTYLPKTYTVTAEYKGIKVSNKIKVKKVLTLKKAKVKRSAKKLVLKATLKEGKKALKGKKVVFKFKGKKYTAKTNKKGIAKVKVKKSVLKKLKKGKKVKYQATYLKHTVKRTAKVKK